jgi:hypothetical protein
VHVPDEVICLAQARARRRHRPADKARAASTQDRRPGQDRLRSVRRTFRGLYQSLAPADRRACAHARRPAPSAAAPRCHRVDLMSRRCPRTNLQPETLGPLLNTDG